jgi:hypothetical protein
MSHPLSGTIPSGRCECTHFARVGEIGECSRCDCRHHTPAQPPASPYRGHDPQTPPGAEAALASFMQALEDAQKALEEAANDEVDAEMDLDEERRALILADKCPQAAGPGRTCTVAYQKAWIDAQPGVSGLIREWKHAKARREAAEKVLRVLERNSSLQQSIARSVSNDFPGTRGTW